MRPIALKNQVAQNLRDFLFEPKTSSLESFFLNLLPAAAILLVFRYFLSALFSALDPSAGMILGGAILFPADLLFSSFFLAWSKSQVAFVGKNSFKDPFVSDLEKRMLTPLKAWMAKSDQY